MKNVTIIYWSGTGNTEAMADAIAEGAKSAGANVMTSTVGNADAAMIKAADAVILGCPSMGAEVLEESEMEPFVAALEATDVAGKPMGLFGSYDWGDGQWMQEWVERMKELGAVVDGEGLITRLPPDDNALAACKALGARLAV
jgi:flavodoxin short chain